MLKETNLSQTLKLGIILSTDSNSLKEYLCVNGLTNVELLVKRYLQYTKHQAQDTDPNPSLSGA